MQVLLRQIDVRDVRQWVVFWVILGHFCSPKTPLEINSRKVSQKTLKLPQFWSHFGLILDAFLVKHGAKTALGLKTVIFTNTYKNHWFFMGLEAQSANNA